MTENDTSWGKAAKWYSSYLETTEDSYQKQVILPGLLRLVDLKPGEKLLDIACGQGFFVREFAKAGWSVEGADISPELIEEAKRLSPDIAYHIAPANKLSFAEKETFDAATVVLAIQNIEDMAGTFAEAACVLKKGGKLFLVLMHPAFRIPEVTSWGYDEAKRVQYRRVDAYLSPRRSELLVHPGQEGSPVTISYHRSLQDFSQALAQAGFAITQIEEWTSHKKSGNGPRRVAEDRSRTEIPLFMMIECVNLPR